MPYYKKAGEANPYWLTDEQVALGADVDLILITEAEADEMRKPKLPEAKQQKRGEMRGACQTALYEPVTAAGQRTWIATAEFSSVVARLIARASRGKPILTNLRPETGARLLTPTLVQIEQIEDAIQAQEDAAQDRLDARLESIKAATTVDEVLAIVW